jgi:acyl carrier protein phosphodiesterase
MDISLDYFLATDPAVNSQAMWQHFAQWAYQSLEAQISWHTGGFKRYFPYLRKENWFVHYAQKPFIENAMANLLKRVGRPDGTAMVLKSFEQHHDYLKEVYGQFFPQLADYVQLKAAALITNPI